MNRTFVLGLEREEAHLLEVSTDKIIYHFSYKPSKINMLSQYNGLMYILFDDSLIELKKNNLEPTVIKFPHKINMFTDIIETDGGHLLLADNNDIYYLNPFGEFFPFKQDLKLPFEDAVPLKLRPPILKYNVPKRDFPSIIVNTDHEYSQLGMSEKEALFLLYATSKGTKKQVILINNLGMIRILTDLNTGTQIHSKEVDTSKRIWIGSTHPQIIKEYPSVTNPVGYIMLTKDCYNRNLCPQDSYKIQSYTWRNQGIPSECIRFSLNKAFEIKDFLVIEE